MYMTMSISTGLYPKLDLLTANKLHYITLQNHNRMKIKPFLPWTPHFLVYIIDGLVNTLEN